MNAGSKSPTEVESPTWATVVHLLVGGPAGARAGAVVVVLVGVDEVVVELGVGVVAGAVVVVAIIDVAGVVVDGVLVTVGGAVTDDSAALPASDSARQPVVDAAATTANASGATRRGRATSRV